MRCLECDSVLSARFYYSNLQIEALGNLRPGIQRYEPNCRRYRHAGRDYGDVTIFRNIPISIFDIIIIIIIIINEND